MKIIRNGNLREFVEVFNESKQVVMWGAGECAKDFEEYYRQEMQKNLEIDYWVDKNSLKWNEENIFPPEKIVQTQCDLVLVATQYTDSVYKELEDLGYDGIVCSVFQIIYKKRWGNVQEIEKNLSGLKEILADEKSKKIVEIICQRRKELNVDYSDIREENQYFVEGIIKRDPNAVFVDGGAYDGESINQFISFQNGLYERVLSFEMNELNYNRIKEKQWDNRVELYNLGLWNEKTICNYSHTEDSSKLGKGEHVAQCIALDDLLEGQKATFIKMDIEGAEINALYGAEKTIKQYRPQLAVCIYHKQNDLWEIPFLIHKMVPEYKLYVRHHDNNINETVLYAVMEE